MLLGRNSSLLRKSRVQSGYTLEPGVALALVFLGVTDALVMCEGTVARTNLHVAGFPRPGGVAGANPVDANPVPRAVDVREPSAKNFLSNTFPRGKENILETRTCSGKR